MSNSRLAFINLHVRKRTRRPVTARPVLEHLEQRRLLAALQYVGTSDLIITTTAGDISNQGTITLPDSDLPSNTYVYHTGPGSVASYNPGPPYPGFVRIQYFTTTPTHHLTPRLIQSRGCSGPAAALLLVRSPRRSLTTSNGITLEVIPSAGEPDDPNTMCNVIIDISSTNLIGSASTTVSYDVAGHQGSLDASSSTSTSSEEAQVVGVPFYTLINLSFDFYAQVAIQTSVAENFGSGYFDVSVEEPPDIAATSLAWSPGGGADFGYSITGGDLPQATTAALYWAPTNTFDPSQDTLAYSTTTQTAQGTYSVHVSPTRASAHCKILMRQ